MTRLFRYFSATAKYAKYAKRKKSFLLSRIWRISRVKLFFYLAEIFITAAEAAGTLTTH